MQPHPPGLVPATVDLIAEAIDLYYTMQGAGGIEAVLAGISYDYAAFFLWTIRQPDIQQVVNFLDDQGYTLIPVAPSLKILSIARTTHEGDINSDESVLVLEAVDGPAWNNNSLFRGPLWIGTKAHAIAYAQTRGRESLVEVARQAGLPLPDELAEQAAQNLSLTEEQRRRFLWRKCGYTVVSDAIKRAVQGYGMHVRAFTNVYDNADTPCFVIGDVDADRDPKITLRRALRLAEMVRDYYKFNREMVERMQESTDLCLSQMIRDPYRTY